jgi:hypothetical protein
MLGLQLVILFLSLGPLLEISAFCSGTAEDQLADIFGGVHLLLLFLLVVGVCSLRFRRLRLTYSALLVITLSALPVQALLVSHGQLHCDLP